MKALKNKNPEGTLRTYQQMADEYNMSVNTIIKLARESGALVKIGRISRVDPEAFHDYVIRTYSVKRGK